MTCPATTILLHVADMVASTDFIAGYCSVSRSMRVTRSPCS